MSADYRHRIRLRVSGLLVEGDALLLVQLKAPTREKPIWMPPGGGVEFGEHMEEALVREFEEETGLGIETGPLRYVNQFVEPPYHAIEFYFDCYRISGEMRLGGDPEEDDGPQRLMDLKFVSLAQLRLMPVEPPFIRTHLPNEYEELPVVSRYFN